MAQLAADIGFGTQQRAAGHWTLNQTHPGAPQHSGVPTTASNLRPLRRQDTGSSLQSSRRVGTGSSAHAPCRVSPLQLAAQTKSPSCRLNVLSMPCRSSCFMSWAAITLGESASVSFFVERSLWSASQHDIERGSDESDGCTCSICLEQVREDAVNEEAAVVTACGHIFHTKCCKQVIWTCFVAQFCRPWAMCVRLETGRYGY